MNDKILLLPLLAGLATAVAPQDGAAAAMEGNEMWCLSSLPPSLPAVVVLRSRGDHRREGTAPCPRTH